MPTDPMPTAFAARFPDAPRVQLGAHLTPARLGATAAGDGDAAAELAERAVFATSVGIADAGANDGLEVAGPDAAEFLHRLLSQEIQALPQGAVRLAALLDRKGGLVAPMRVERLASDRFALLTPPGLGPQLRAQLERVLIMEDATITPLADTHAAVAFIGPRAADLLTALGLTRPPPDQLITLAPSSDGDKKNMLAGGVISDAPIGGCPAVQLRAPLAALDAAWPTILDAAARLGGRPVGHGAVGALHVEQGVPRLGIDFQLGGLLKEFGYDAAVSFTKGCYPGQETTYRLHYRGRPARRLIRLRISLPLPSYPPSFGPQAPGEPAWPEITMVDGGKPVGQITSAARDPSAPHTHARAIARLTRAGWSEDAVLTLRDPTGVAAQQGATVDRLGFAGPDVRTRDALGPGEQKRA